MKIILDVDKLLEEGRITKKEYVRLCALAIEETGSLAFNILIGFGVIATAGGTLALIPSGLTAIVLGFLLSAIGASLSAAFTKEWGLLGAMLLIVGSITAGGGIIFATDGSVSGCLTVTLLFLVGSVLAKSSLLAALAVLSLSSTLGAVTGYRHATYMLFISQPTVTIVVFSLLAWGSHLLAKVLPLDYERLGIMVARTSLFVVNFGFLVGSLWGDSPLNPGEKWRSDSSLFIPDLVFVVVWALGLVGTGIWAARADKRWVVNLLAVFGAIHFYTQYFERLGANPGSILIAGLVALGIAFAVVAYNKAAVAAPAEGPE